MKTHTATRALIGLGALLLGACASNPVENLKSMLQSPGTPHLAAGMKKYEDAQYKEAAAKLEHALAAGLTRADEVQARKYLAFIHCSSNRQQRCRSEFRKALEIDPQLELQPAETGHPLWDPVFRSVKAHSR